MKTTPKVSLFSLLAVYGAASLVGCTYEAPQTTQTVGTGGNDATSSSGQGGSSGQASGGAGGIGGTGGAGGAGGDSACKQGDVQPCGEYSGPAGTEATGACKRGTSECTQAGTWDACMGEVIPTRETCASDIDVNCDGNLPCTGTPIQTFPYSSSQSGNSDFILAMATGDGGMGRDGSVYAVGGRDGSPPETPNNLRVLVWHRDQHGMFHDWSGKFAFTSFGGVNGAVATGVSVSAKTGEVYIAGSYVAGSLTIGSQKLPDSPSSTGFVARFAASGDFINARAINTSGSMAIRTLTTDTDGAVYIAGSYQFGPTVDLMPFAPTALSRKGFVMQLKAGLDSGWKRPFLGAGSHEVAAISTKDLNNLVIATEFTGQMTFEKPMGALQAVDAGTTPDILVNQLRNADGFTQWFTQIPGDGVAATLEVGGLAANSSGVLVGGRFTRQVLIGTMTYMNDPSNAATDGFLAYMEPTNGMITDSHVSGGPGIQDIHGIAVDSASDFIVTGAFSNTFKLPPKELANSDAVDVFVFKTGANLDGKWIQRFYGSDDQVGQAVVLGKTVGNIFIGGAFKNQLIGITPALSTPNSFDAFLLQMSN